MPTGYSISENMIQLPPKKRVPELKLKKLDVSDPNPKRPLVPALPSVTTVIDGIPIVEYIYELGQVESEFLGRNDRSPIICLDSSDSTPNSPNNRTLGGSYENSPIISIDFSKEFSPEPIRTVNSENNFFENDIRQDSFVAMKKPTRWDTGPRNTYKLDIRNRTESINDKEEEFLADSNFTLQPRYCGYRLRHRI